MPDSMNSPRSFHTILVRRGDKVVKDFPTKLLIPNIKNKKLLGSDEISADGGKWVRLDRHRQLEQFFQPQNPQTNSETASDSPSASPPGFDAQMAELAEMLREING